MDRLISLLADALSAAVGDLGEARADLATSISRLAAAQQDAKDLRTQLDGEHTLRRKHEADLAAVVGLAIVVRDTRNFSAAPLADVEREQREHEAAVEALVTWLRATLDREIPF